MVFPKILKIAIISNLGIFDINKTEKGVTVTGGLEYKLLKLLSEGLKFQYELLVPDEMQWGWEKEDGNWTGLTEMIRRNQADIALSKIGYTYDRARVVNFSFPYGIETMPFATKAPAILGKEMAIIKPFTPEVWLYLLISIIFVSFFIKFLLKEKYSMTDIVFSSIGRILLQSLELKSTKLGNTVFIFSWTLSAMFISYSYTALLLSFLTFPIKEPTINNKQMLLNAIKTDSYRCYSFRGSNLVKSFLVTQDDVVKAIGEEIVKNDWYITASKDSISECIIKGKQAVLAASNDFKFMPQDQVFIPDDDFGVIFWAIQVKKEFCCLRQLDSFIHKMTASGLLKKISDDFYFRQMLAYNKKEVFVESTLELELNEVSGAFFLLCLGYGIASIVLFSEVMHFRLKNKH